MARISFLPSPSLRVCRRCLEARSASVGEFGRIALVCVIEHQGPIALLALGRGGEFAFAFVRVGPDFAPGSLPRVVPMGYDVLAGNLIHVDADRPALRRVGDEEAAIRGPSGLDVTFTLSLP